MANENLLGLKPFSMKAGGTITKGNLLKLDGSNSKQVVRTTAITDFVVGVAGNSGVSGDQIDINPNGSIAKVIAAAATTINAELMPHGSTNGQCADAAGATARTIGIGLEAAGAAGDVIEVLMVACPKGPPNA